MKRNPYLESQQSRLEAGKRAIALLNAPKEDFQPEEESEEEESGPEPGPEYEPDERAPTGLEGMFEEGRVPEDGEEGEEAEEAEPEPPKAEGEGPGVSIAPDFVFPYDVVTQSIGIVAARGSGKALALGTPIPTPGGWTTMGEIQAGDLVLDESGKPCRVVKATEVMRGHECYEVEFSDGTVIVADAEHLWLTEDRSCRAANRRTKGTGRAGRPQCARRAFPEARTTREILKTLRSGGKRRDLEHSVLNALPLELPEAELPIHPYVLGCWLGNGTAQNATITTPNRETLSTFTRLGYEVGEPFNPSKNDISATYRVGKGPDGVPLQTHLRRLGLLMNKSVPAPYLRGSIDQRKALLAGLIDTDGTIAEGSNMVTFGNMNRQIADAVMELVASLGWSARLGTRRAKLNGVDYGEFFNVSFTPTSNVFWVERKAKRFKTGIAQQSKHLRRMIVDVRKTASVPVKCIAVDSPSHLYLAGRAMVPTHNTYLTQVMTEELYLAGLPFVVIDPVGVYWGLRSSAGGQDNGLDVYILGGERGDVPLDASSGKAIARWLLDYRRPTVLDLSLMRKAEQRVFVADLAEELYERSKLPLHIIVDEADLFIPQRASPEEKRVLAAFEDIVRRGRVRGLGITVVTQRPAVIHKDILTQIGTLIVLRMLGPQDRKSIEEWIKYHGDPHKQRIVLSSLGSLPIGTAWVWSPGWLGVLKRVAIRQKITFDSSVTPRAHEDPPPPPEVWNEIDVDTLRAQLSDAISHDPNDPSVMKARIAELEAALSEGDGVGAKIGGTIIAKLQKRIQELEKRLIQNAPKIKTFDPVAFVVHVEKLAGTVERIEQALVRDGKLAKNDDDEAEEPVSKKPGKKR